MMRGHKGINEEDAHHHPATSTIHDHLIELSHQDHPPQGVQEVGRKVDREAKTEVEEEVGTEAAQEIATEVAVVVMVAGETVRHTMGVHQVKKSFLKV